MVDGKTQVLGVIGDPIEHTFSPAMHNAGLDALNLNYIYEIKIFILDSCSISASPSILQKYRGKEEFKRHAGYH